MILIFMFVIMTITPTPSASGTPVATLGETAQGRWYFRSTDGKELHTNAFDFLLFLISARVNSILHMHEIPTWMWGGVLISIAPTTNILITVAGYSAYQQVRWLTPGLNSWISLFIYVVKIGQKKEEKKKAKKNGGRGRYRIVLTLQFGSLM
jgi:hypothetical protein